MKYFTLKSLKYCPNNGVHLIGTPVDGLDRRRFIPAGGGRMIASRSAGTRFFQRAGPDALRGARFFEAAIGPARSGSARPTQIHTGTGRQPVQSGAPGPTA